MIKWLFGKGSMILIGLEHIISVCNMICLSMDTIEALQSRGLFFLERVIRKWSGQYLIWKEVEDIGLHEYMLQEWKGYIQDLRQAGLCRNSRGDMLVWVGRLQHGFAVVGYIYMFIMSTKFTFTNHTWFLKISKWHVPMKNNLFNWMV